MAVWVLVLVSLSNKNQIFLNTFDSQIKCEKRIKEMEPIYEFQCVKTTLNK